MTLFQKIKNCLIGVLFLLVAVILIFSPDEAYALIPAILGITLLIYGFTFLWYYLRMARHMVGGRAFLYRGIIIMDVALFTTTIYTLNNNRFIVLIYLLGVYAFTGVVDVLRAGEARQNGDSGWKWKMSRGVVSLLFTVALFIIGFIIGRTDIFVYGYSFSLVYMATMRIIGAFRKTDMVCIQ